MSGKIERKEGDAQYTGLTLLDVNLLMLEQLVNLNARFSGVSAHLIDADTVKSVDVQAVLKNQADEVKAAIQAPKAV